MLADSLSRLIVLIEMGNHSIKFVHIKFNRFFIEIAGITPKGSA